MTKLLKSLFGAALLATAAFSSQAQANTQPFQGIVLVPPAVETVTSMPSKAFGFKRGKIVAFATDKPAGSVIVVTRQHALYFILGNGLAVKYRVATAKPGFEWSGAHTVASKAVWPSWRPPAQMRKRRPELPEFMAGGPENPLGARAIYIGGTIYRIHGTNEPSSIGKSASSGCIRMLNADVQ
jgi:lipoprotein-anchoring transpeptidase ErfK/SrfK